MISNSGHDENGRYSGGKAGDQTSTEWQVIPWYNRPWTCVLRHPNPTVRALLAKKGKQAAENNLVGYDQSERGTYWKHLAASNYDPSKITVACEADCSAGVIANTKAVGYDLNISALKNIGATYTGNMRAEYKKAGFEVLTDSKYLTSDKYLLAGDILLYDGHHTATNLDNGSLAVQKKSNEEIAQEVIEGKWGVQPERQKKLEAAGYNYETIRALVNAMSKSNAPAVSYYPKYTGKSGSIVDALTAVGEKDTSFSHRTKIATKNGISGYKGNSAQNTKLLELLKSGKLIKA